MSTQPSAGSTSIRLSEAEWQRVTDALEVLAENYNRANMIRAREQALVLRANILQQSSAGEPSNQECK